MTFDLQTILQILAVLLGSAVVPLLISLVTRRAQLRQLNTSSDSNIVTSATNLVTALQSQIKILNERIMGLEGDRDSDRARIGRLQTDLDTTRRQITALGVIVRAPLADVGHADKTLMGPTDPNFPTMLPRPDTDPGGRVTPPRI